MSRQYLQCWMLWIWIPQMVEISSLPKQRSGSQEWFSSMEPVQPICLFVFSFWRDNPQRDRTTSFTSFLYHIQRRTTLGRTPLDEWSAFRRDLYLTTHNTQNRQTSMPPVGFEPTISTGERPQAYALDRTATRTGSSAHMVSDILKQNTPRPCFALFVFLKTWA